MISKAVPTPTMHRDGNVAPCKRSASKPQRALALGLVLAALSACAHQPKSDHRVEVVARMQQAPGNITVTPDNRIITTLHPFHGADDRVVEVARDGTTRVFPNAEWGTGGRKADGSGFDAPLGIRTDANGVVWILDTGVRARIAPRLVGWDTRADRLKRIYDFSVPADQPVSFLNDFQVSLRHNTAFIADTALGGTPALVVLDMNTGRSRWLLKNHPYLQPENQDLVAEGRVLTIGEGTARTPARVGLNPIGLDADEAWLYFGTMNGNKLYRVRTTDLLDTALSDAEPPRESRRPFGVSHAALACSACCR
ncbi:MAG: L-dopachrome tautomerase-related protein [Luteimonas sp.]